MNRRLLAASALATFLVLGCQKEANQPLTETSEFSESSILAAQTQLADLVKTHQWTAKIDLAIAEHEHPNAKKLSKTIISDKYRQLAANSDFNHYRELIRQAINPNDYQCAPTAMHAYIRQSIKNWSGLDMTLYSAFGDIPFLEAYLLDNTEGGDYYGADGEFSNEVKQAFKGLKQFWGGPTDLIIGDAHGSVYKNTALVTKVLIEGYVNQDAAGNIIPVDPEEAAAVAKMLKTVFASKNFMNYKHPLFTLNAFADEGVPALGIPKKLVIGDGIMKMDTDLGYGAVAVCVNMAHEFGHHIQFAHKYIPKISTPEATRRIELMADAYAGYYVAHKQGWALPASKTQQIVDEAYIYGDCAFQNPNHHGTPNQRKKAAAFGLKLATDAKTAASKLTSQQFFTAFEAALPTILLPDAR
jgi:hypothetical protein